MNVKIKNIVDNIMEKMHQISWWMMEYEKCELSGKIIPRKQIEENKAINMIFKDVQKQYRLLEEAILDNVKKENNYMYYGLYEEDMEDDTDILNLDDESIVEEDKSEIANTLIDDIKLYLEGSYISLRYLTYRNSVNKPFTDSIYENTPFEKLINTEYYLQCSNLDNIEKRIEMQKNPQGLSFKDKSEIIHNVSYERYYKGFAIKRLDESIKATKRKYNKESPEYKYQIEKLCEEKYIQYYKYLNNRYNGVIQENDRGKFAEIKSFIDNKAETVILNMPEFEIEQNIKLNIREMEDDLKCSIYEITESKNCKTINSVKSKNRNKNNRIERIEK